MKRRFWGRSGLDRPPVPPGTQQRLDGWLALLDDPDQLEAAQAALRLPLDQLPPPPAAPGAPAVPALRGAYARRARRSGGTA